MVTTDVQLFETQDGSHSVLSGRYGVSYHSRYGAIRESMHVFIEAGLRLRGFAKDDLAVFEMGLGTGLNALLTWLEARAHGWKVRYAAVETDPLPLEVVDQLNYADTLGKPEAQGFLRRIHESPWGAPIQFDKDRFTFSKVRKSLEEVHLPDSEYDVVYFDAFAPDVQPELWTEDIFCKLWLAMAPGGVLTTYSAKGAVRRALKAAGFEVEKLPGPPGKREMTLARKPAAI
ncbi:MAG: SAM-dependent methyltransferase [Bacteroidetes bacterium]|nr:MAG: SAM-dependent methyltransferase [Bacteroidota bacterium]